MYQNESPLDNKLHAFLQITDSELPKKSNLLVTHDSIVTTEKNHRIQLSIGYKLMIFVASLLITIGEKGTLFCGNSIGKR